MGAAGRRAGAAPRRAARGLLWLWLLAALPATGLRLGSFGSRARAGLAEQGASAAATGVGKTRKINQKQPFPALPAPPVAPPAPPRNPPFGVHEVKPFRPKVGEICEAEDAAGPTSFGGIYSNF